MIRWPFVEPQVYPLNLNRSSRQTNLEQGFLGFILFLEHNTKRCLSRNFVICEPKMMHLYKDFLKSLHEVDVLVYRKGPRNEPGNCFGTDGIDKTPIWKDTVDRTFSAKPKQLTAVVGQARRVPSDPGKWIAHRMLRYRPLAPMRVVGAVVFVERAVQRQAGTSGPCGR